MNISGSVRHVLVLGAGYAGLMAATRLARQTDASVAVTLVNAADTADVNGKPALLVRRGDGTPLVVVSIDVDRTRIRSIWAIGNPDKLGAV